MIVLKLMKPKETTKNIKRKASSYFYLAGLIGFADLAAGYQIKKAQEACDGTGGLQYILIGLYLFFIVVILLAPLGHTLRSKLLFSLLKILVIVVFGGVLFLTSFALCF